MGPQARMAAGKAPHPEAGDQANAAVGPFVINLCSSTTPMALSHPDAPEMKRFSFFVSRRREDNRERFRLHMGYFSTLAEAEEWLSVVRDVYPGAWAGEAPGKKLRARAAAAAMAGQLPPPPTAPRVVSVTAKPAPTAPARAAAPVVARQAMPSAADLIVPTLHAAPAPLARNPSATGTHRAFPDPSSTGAHRALNPSATGMHRALPDPSATGSHRALQNPSATGMHRALPDPSSATGTHRALPDPSSTGAHHALTNPSATGTHRALPDPSATGSHRALQNPSATGMHRALPDPSATGSHRALQNPSATGTNRALAPQTPGRPAAAQPRPGTTPGAPVRAPQQAARPAAPPAQRSAQPPRQGAPKQQPAAAATRQPAKAVPKKQPPVPAALSGSNVREVMAALDETGETRQMRVPAFNPNPAASAPSVARGPTSPASAAPGVPAARASVPAARSPRGPVPAAEPPRAKAPVQRPQAPAVQADSPSLSDTQVLRFLEQRRDENAERVDEHANAGISLLKPDDTQTRLALKEAVRENAPVSFAVQLYWSVSPVELDKVPPLAIFSAYTLYTVEGSREGRKWYGLRLGFFSDAISAKQVAYYVRSEFASVAVVPVSPQEKSRAGAEENKAATGQFAKRKVLEQKSEEFKLFEDAKPAAPVALEPAQPTAADKAAAAKPGAKAPPKKNKPLGKVRAKEQKSAKTLEETLEILGASDLEIDNGRGEVLNDTGVRHLRVEVQKNTPFAKLLDRLSEKVRRN